MRIAIMGSGGLGGVFGGALSQAGADVTFIARGAHLQALQENGLQVLSAAGDFHLTDVRAVADPKGLAGC
jgi:2-dehydropantoate 2-reductase